jgi:predicted MPP superfamily phosphohydrolase
MIVLFVALYLSTYIYIANRILYVLKISSAYSYFFYAILLCIGLISGIVFAVRRYTYSFITIIAPLCYVIIGVWAISISFCVINELLNLINLIFKIKNFRYNSTLIVLSISALSSIWALINVAFILNIKEITLKTPQLKTDSLKIVQLSDVHINDWTNEKEINNIFDKVVSLKPDIIVLTGDIIDTDINKNDRYKNFGLDKLKAKHGVYAISGNHDHYTGIDVYYEMLEKANIKPLKNESVLLDGIINIAGIEDISHKSKKIINEAITGSDKNYPVIFLSHRPEAFEISKKMGSEYNIIQFSGHTHGGQIPPIEIFRRFFMKYNYGLFYDTNAVMYLSSGTRWWGPPMRFGNFCEIAVINLER